MSSLCRLPLKRDERLYGHMLQSLFEAVLDLCMHENKGRAQLFWDQISQIKMDFFSQKGCIYSVCFDNTLLPGKGGSFYLRSKYLLKMQHWQLITHKKIAFGDTFLLIKIWTFFPRATAISLKKRQGGVLLYCAMD